MSTTPSNTTRSPAGDHAARHGRAPAGFARQAASGALLLAMQVALALLANTAHAQSSACEQLKATLAARINSGIRDYSLEAVPAATPMPPGAKVIGTCEGGAYKILLRRGGAATQPAAPANTASAAASPASAPASAAAPLAQATQRSPEVQPARGLQPTPTPAPSPTPRPVVQPMKAAPAAVAAPAPEREAARVEPAARPERAVDAAVAAASAPVPPQEEEKPEANNTSFGQRALALLAEYWPWLAGLTLLPLGAWLWSWIAYRRAYDAAGLPRGPKLN